MSLRRSAGVYRFRLFVTGDAPNSTQAIANLNSLCLDYLPDRHEIEVVDVLLEPARALLDKVMMTPTLVKLAPGKVCKIVGTLNQKQPVLLSLGLRNLAS